MTAAGQGRGVAKRDAVVRKRHVAVTAAGRGRGVAKRKVTVKKRHVAERGRGGGGARWGRTERDVAVVERLVPRACCGVGAREDPIMGYARR
jgi:hypothetical protein